MKTSYLYNKHLKIFSPQIAMGTRYVNQINILMSNHINRVWVKEMIKNPEKLEHVQFDVEGATFISLLRKFILTTVIKLFRNF